MRRDALPARRQGKSLAFPSVELVDAADQVLRLFRDQLEGPAPPLPCAQHLALIRLQIALTPFAGASDPSPGAQSPGRASVNARAGEALPLVTPAGPGAGQTAEAQR